MDARFLAGQWGGAIPMAPSTALASVGLPASLGLLVLAQFIAGFDLGVERALARTNELFGQIPLGRMSPLTRPRPFPFEDRDLLSEG